MSEKANTALTYLYRDADNYKATRTVILSGALQPGDLEKIFSGLDDGLWFIPSQVGLDDLQGDLQQYDTDQRLDSDGCNPSDRVWHELQIPDGVIATNEKPDLGAMSCAELVDNFASVRWDETVPMPTA